MCTISWFFEAGPSAQEQISYHVFFNRDEGLGRAPASPPTTVKSGEQNGIASLMPIDPEGGGSWLAANQAGMTFALLNFYQGRTPKGKLLSRGNIVKNISCKRSCEEVENYLNTLNLHRYAPFSLLVFSQEQSSCDNFSVPLYQWTGKNLLVSRQESPLFSSAVDYDKVTSSRMRVYGEMISSVEPASIAEHTLLHASHLPEKSRRSICMHREDACTVSFSHVGVGPDQIVFDYQDGAPCEQGPVGKYFLSKVDAV